MNLQKSAQSGNFIAGAGVASAVGSRVANALVPHTFIRRVEADGVKIFYRDAVLPEAPTVLLLHGFPASSFMYRELIPRLADRYRVIFLRRAGTHDACVHGRARSQALCALRLDYGATGRLSLGDCAPGTRNCNHFAERQCL